MTQELVIMLFEFYLADKGNKTKDKKKYIEPIK